MNEDSFLNYIDLFDWVYIDSDSVGIIYHNINILDEEKEQEEDE